MDADLYRAVTAGINLHLLTQNKDKLFREKTGGGNTVLHLASQYGQLEAVKLILSLNNDLLLVSNEAGEYALHFAARGGHASVVRALLDYAKFGTGPHMEEEFLERGEARMRINADRLHKMLTRERYIEGYTALHDAVQYHHVDIVRMLIEEDPNYSYGVSSYDDDETPLYLAARRGFDDLVEVILTNCKSPAFTGPHRRTALHAALICTSKECVELLLKWKPTLIKEQDIKKNTPLHYVAHLGYADFVRPLLSNPDLTSVAKVRNIFRYTALHIAASRGHVLVMKEILLCCPDSWDMVGDKGRNILHIAVAHRQLSVIQYILHEDCQIIDKTQLINKKDFEGNTPLHLLSTSDCFAPQLASDPMVDKGVLNCNNMTALDLVTINDESSMTETKIREELKGGGATSGLPQLIRKYDIFEELEQLKKRAETHTVVTTLVATITFAAGVTMPGGFIQSGSPHEGMSILTKSAAFHVFIVSDTIALLLSTTAIFFYFVSSLRHLRKIRILQLLIAAVYLNQAALVAMMVAFVTGTFAVLGNSISLASLVCVIGSTFLVVYIVVMGIYVGDRSRYRRGFPTRPWKSYIYSYIFE